MTTKAAKEEQNYKVIDPPVLGEIEHTRSRQRHTLTFDARHRGQAHAIWTGTGKVMFDLKTGYGASECRDWRLTQETARELTGNAEHTFSEPPRTDGGRPKVYRAARTPTKQLSLLDGTGQVREEVKALAVPPPPPPSQPQPPPLPDAISFQGKAHRQLMGAKS